MPHRRGILLLTDDYEPMRQSTHVLHTDLASGIGYLLNKSSGAFLIRIE